jgi:hypothetical protein
VFDSSPFRPLYTNAVMTENLALHARLGTREDQRRIDQGFARVFLSKRLSGAAGSQRPAR